MYIFIMTYSAIDIANKVVVQLTDLERGDVVTNLKLQKLLYYVQGYHLAFFGTPLFDEKLEAWMYGPVVPEVYRNFRENGRVAIMVDPEVVKMVELGEAAEDMFNQVMNEYGKFSAIRLMEMTHTEKPWLDAFNSEDKVIDLETMKNYFSKLVDE